jgi:hypothetical protein
MTKTTPENVPKALDAIADIVLSYKPKPKTKGAKKRKKRVAKLARAKSTSLDLR